MSALSVPARLSVALIVIAFWFGGSETAKIAKSAFSRWASIATLCDIGGNNFATVEKLAHFEHPYSMPYEHFDIFYCRGLKWPLKDIWPRVKNWD